MARDSYTVRRKRRFRRNISLSNRHNDQLADTLKRQSAELASIRYLLFFVLHDLGGEQKILRKNVHEILHDIQSYHIETSQEDAEGSFVVRLVKTEPEKPAETAEPSVQTEQL